MDLGSWESVKAPFEFFENRVPAGAIFLKKTYSFAEARELVYEPLWHSGNCVTPEAVSYSLRAFVQILSYFIRWTKIYPVRPCVETSIRTA